MKATSLGAHVAHGVATAPAFACPPLRSPAALPERSARHVHGAVRIKDATS
jgi:hypothetical protein